jgi:hypothetical protein
MAIKASSTKAIVIVLVIVVLIGLAIHLAGPQLMSFTRGMHGRG